jgi:hypothetical protein
MGGWHEGDVAHGETAVDRILVSSCSGHSIVIQSIEISDVCQVDGVRHVILAISISSLGGMVEGSGDADAG